MDNNFTDSVCFLICCVAGFLYTFMICFLLLIFIPFLILFGVAPSLSVTSAFVLICMSKGSLLILMIMLAQLISFVVWLLKPIFTNSFNIKNLKESNSRKVPLMLLWTMFAISIIYPVVQFVVVCKLGLQL